MFLHFGENSFIGLFVKVYKIYNPSPKLFLGIVERD